MAYIPKDITFDPWASPISIDSVDYITDLDDAINDIITNDPQSLVIFTNAQMAKIPPYLSTELAKIAAEVTEASENAERDAWIAEAEAATAQSYAVEPYGVYVKRTISNGDGTFTETTTGDFSSLHYSTISAQPFPLPVSPRDNGTILTFDNGVTAWKKPKEEIEFFPRFHVEYKSTQDVTLTSTDGAITKKILPDDWQSFTSDDIITQISLDTDSSENVTEVKILRIVDLKTLAPLPNPSIPWASTSAVKEITIGEDVDSFALESMQKAFAVHSDSSGFIPDNINGLGNLNTSRVTTFEGCFSFTGSGVTGLDLSSWDFASAEKMDNMFKVPSVTCLSNLDTRTATDKENIFEDVSSMVAPDSSARTVLSSPTGSDWVNYNSCGGSVIPRFSAIAEVDGLGDITDPSNFAVVGGAATMQDLGNDQFYIYSDDPISHFSFWSASGILHFELLSGEDLTSLSGSFNSEHIMDTNSRLESVVFSPSFDFSKVTTLDCAFEKCDNLKCISRLDTSHAPITSGMFDGCTSLEAPNASEQTALLDIAGDDWTNASPCP